MPQLVEPLKTYHRVLVNEFIREWQFLFDVLAGRSEKRADFTDKLVSIIKSSVNMGLSQASNATGAPGLDTIGAVFELAVDWGNEKRKARHDEAIATQEYQFDNEEIRLLLEAVALEACRRYQRVILQQLSDNPMKGVVPFAKTGVERMLEYLVRSEKPLTFENLLDGLIAGHSGAYVMGYTNTQLELKEGVKKKKLQIAKQKIAGLTGFTAEGVYGRSAFITDDGTLYALLDKKKARHNHDAEAALATLNEEKITFGRLKETITLNKKVLYKYGYTKPKKKNSHEPKYGYVQVGRGAVNQWYGHLNEVEYKQNPSALNPEYLSKVNGFRCCIVAIDFNFLKGFLEIFQPDPPISLKTHIKNTLAWSEVEIVVYEPSNSKDRDLTSLNFSGLDLSDCVFQGCIFSGNLDNTIFENADCRFSDFTRVTSAVGANFTSAELHRVNLRKANFKKANFNGANLSYALVEEASLEGAAVLGATWYKAKVSRVKTEQNLEKLQALQSQFMIDQNQKLKGLETSLQDQQLMLNSLRSQFEQLQTQNQPETESLQQVLQEVYKEQQARLDLERNTKNELIRLGAFQAKTQENIARQAAETEVLKQQVIVLKKHQEEFSKTVTDVQVLASSVLKHEVAIDVLDIQVSSLTLNLENVIESQRAEFKYLTEQIGQVRNKVQDLQQQVTGLEGQQVKDRTQLTNLDAAFQAQQQAVDALKRQLETLQNKPAAESEALRGVLEKLTRQEQTQTDNQSTIEQLTALVKHLTAVIPTMNHQALKQQEQQEVLALQMKAMQSQLTKLAMPERSSPSISDKHRIPYYDIAFERLLAKGSFGKIYLGKWEGRTVAIKTLEGRLTALEEHRFVREVEIMSRLKHPNITTFYGACLENKQACLVMEHMEKDTLTKALRSLTPEQQKSIALDIVRALMYLHNLPQPVFHRDLRSSHVLLDSKGTAKLTDFGLSKIDALSVQSAKAASDALPWQAPECFVFRAEYTAASDIYSFGVILWEIFTGKLPEDESKTKKYETLGERQPIPSTIPTEIAALIKLCWSVNPSLRPNAKRLVEQIEAFRVRPPSPAPDVYYEQGLAFERQKDFQHAFESYKKAAEKNHTKAKTNLGNFYLTAPNQVVAIDKPKALTLFEEAGNEKHIRGMFNAAQMLEYGDGVPKDTKRALTWYQKILQQNPNDQDRALAVRKCEKLQSSLASGPAYQLNS